MATKRPARLFSDLAIPPGDLLKEEIATVGMTQQELADRTGRPVQAVNEIIHGKKSITHETALELEKVLGVPAHIWVNLQATYDLTNARNREIEELQGQEDWLKEFPVREMEKRRWIEKYTAKHDKVRALLAFLGVTSFPIWQESAQDLLGFRISPASKVSMGSLATWLRKGESDGHAVETKPYDEKRFWMALGEVRSLTNKSSEIFVSAMRELCADTGIAVVFVQELPKSGANGVARWLRKDKGLIQLSLRNKWSDIFWFSFFHEACHILKHQTRTIYIDGINGDPDSEGEANEFARDFLISPEDWQQFVSSPPYTTARVQKFSEKIGISPGIVVGRLQHDHLIPWTSGLTRLKCRYTWK